ncbi:hypothetical protein [Sphingorhabdus sp. YGSMI21]|uniref:hypothetical protein n=1 Tax=Sphingorhabdus sp. YGSMI21 TaxID=2077182 RepID=UPI000C1E3EDE|nr:hypothetical protein [Sphingorhabdus sp. YGSMI21]ATW05118.1 hypothetical protein CHN51_17475 [Sphingorhabdus sp. YGSMI21]
MRVKASTCREQEARQLDLATNDPLESRRKVAAAAAKAWGLEAIQAEKREAGHVSPRDRLDAEITQEFAEETESDAAQGGR